MRFVKAALICALVVLGSSRGASADGVTFLSLHSEPGDFIGQGLDYLYTEADSAFDLGRNFDAGIEAHISRDGAPLDDWFLNLSAPGDAPLAVGVYEGATRWPFQSASAPGLDFSGHGRGSNTLTGLFEILEVSYGSGGEVLRLLVDFEQHSEGAAPALYGRLAYNSLTLAVPEPATLAMTILGLAGVGALGFRRIRRHRAS